MLAKPVIPALILSPSLSIFFFFNNQFKLNKSDSLVACLSFLSMASNLDITGEEDGGEVGRREKWERKGEPGGCPCFLSPKKQRLLSFCEPENPSCYFNLSSEEAGDQPCSPIRFRPFVAFLLKVQHLQASDESV